MPDGIVLLLASAPCLGLGKLPKLVQSILLPASQGFNGVRDKADSLPLTGSLVRCIENLKKWKIVLAHPDSHRGGHLQPLEKNGIKIRGRLRDL